MTNKEKLAEEWANKRCPESGPEFVVWQMCKEDYLGGYERGQEILREEFNTIIKKLDDELGFGKLVNTCLLLIQDHKE